MALSQDLSDIADDLQVPVPVGLDRADSLVPFLKELASRVRKSSVHVPASLTKVSGGTPVGTVAGVQTMLDGTIYEVAEDAATPGFEIEFNFTGITKPPAEIVLRLQYSGTSTHDVSVDLWDYTGTPAYKQVSSFSTMLNYQVLVIPVANFAPFISSAGAAKLRLIHNTAGNASHDIYIDYVALRL